MNKHLFIMLKEPQAGRVKTRLGADMGMTRAAWWFRHQASDLIRRLSADRRWRTVLAVAPDHAGLQSRIWPNHLPKWPQGSGNLGDRMGRVFRHAPNGPVVIIGADIPNITPELIDRAFRTLGDHDAVFGPAPDGGYWLIGLKRGANAIPRGLFDNVRWSSEHTLADTKATLAGASVAFIDVLQDVDHLSDLQRIKRDQ
ncbi:hypothetical protein BFP76_10130 [Amylibacter kogurei]|uniref:Glycosyltransferase n=1 Tax=Paramylibacter kogurei TaxID=1889778 RepID=A0A2G5K2D4_9RHOB|nr:TIGR04282 family arsenosugar biosynthesis glycosyltransferase [Amylibacter kogurei]PIB22874.1 hypothetical protein BFP76_10130 [Amylibacter kogurei]